MVIIGVSQFITIVLARISMGVTIQNDKAQQGIHNICEEIIKGEGWVMLPGIFDPEIIESAKDVIIKNKFEHEPDHNDDDASQNNYCGLTWGLLSKGEVFAKIATHPLTLSVCRQILGAKCRLSSLSANTVLPGMEGQQPHLDYPYHRYLWPSKYEDMPYPTTTLMSLTVVTLLTDFNPENGSTALIPGSQLKPEHPDDKDLFYEKCEQVTGRAGDVMIIAGSIQHCAMVNKSSLPRSAILQQMVPLFVTPFEDIRGTKGEADEEIQSILAMDHEHPTLKYGTQK